MEFEGGKEKRPSKIRIISVRKATKNEETNYFKEIAN